MHILTSRQDRIELQLVNLREGWDPTGRDVQLTVEGQEDASRLSSLVTNAARTIFEMGGSREAKKKRILPTVFRERKSRILRMVYKEIVIRFRKKTAASTRKKILEKYGFGVRSRNRFIPDQFVVFHPHRKKVGADLVGVANDWAEMDEVVFATPNFVSEYRRIALPAIHVEQWHLRNKGPYQGQKAGEDVDARGAWKITTGRPGICVAVLDDGVDIDHVNLKSRVKKNPDPGDNKDKYGRDFFVPETSRDHYDPRPKLFHYPYDRMLGNDIHGTPCAGVAVSAGVDVNVRGIAPGCRLLPVKIFHADDIADDSRVANAIRYAAMFADVLSCSWSGPRSTDIELAVEDAANGRDGKGSAVFCASGNESGRPPGHLEPVGYPAALPGTIAVGASTDQGRRAPYSNGGPELDHVAPSSGGVCGIYTTDVSYPNRGFNVGEAAAGGADGRHTNDFSGTSSATPLSAGVGALVLSVKPKLSRDELRDLLNRTAKKIGTGYDHTGHSEKLGYGRIDAAAAVEEAKSL